MITDSILVGDHPNDLCISRNGRTLFVANANDNSVSVVDIKNRKLLETLDAALYPESPVGSTTNGVALSENEQRFMLRMPTIIAWPYLMSVIRAHQIIWLYSRGLVSNWCESHWQKSFCVQRQGL